MKKISAILLLALMLAGTLLSCGGNDGETSESNAETTTISEEETQEEELSETVRIEPDLPEGLNYEGYEFTFLCHQEGSAGWDWITNDPREIVSEEETGEPIEDAVYRRNTTIEAKYNVKINMITDPNENTLLNRAVKSGDDIYDAVIIFNNNVPGVVQGDNLTEIGKLAYIDQSKPWWDPAVNSMSVSGKNFLLAGDLLILDNEATNAMIFNKDMIANMGIDLPYKAVSEGKWTMDMLHGLVRDAGSDINGDGVMQYADDQFGLITFNDTLHALLVAGGGAFAEKNAEDIPEMVFANAKNIAIFEKAMDLMYKNTNPSVFNVQSVDAGSGNVTWMAAYYNPFSESRALFMWIRMRVVEVFRGMDANFGILPMPKYDETQENYRSLVNPYTGVMLGIPKSVQDLDRTGIILEALSAESKYTLQPAYYDVVLQRKFTRDDESGAMLDIIFNTRIYDIGGVYSFGNIFGDMNTIAGNEDRNIVSHFEKRGAAMQTAIDRMVAKIESLE